MKENLTFLGIETSCDETAASVVREKKDGTGEILSNIVSSQIEEHKEFGGVVPEVASREHECQISYIVDRALEKAHITYQELDGIAVTYGAGLMGALLVGLNYAKGLSIARSIPLVGVSTLDILAHMQPKVDCVLLAVIAAGRNRIVSGKYNWQSDSWKADGAPYITTWHKIIQETESGSYYICGEVDSVDRSEFDENVLLAPPPLNVRRAAHLISIARKRMDTGDLEDSNAMSPYYLRTT